MFETLLSEYLKPAGDADERSQLEGRLLLLRLVALNFQDVPINLKPLFKQFDEQLAGTPDLRDGLRAIAQEVARRQAFRMTFEEGFDSGEREVRPGDTLQFPQYGVEIGVGEIAPDGVKVTLKTPNGEIGPFTAGYFDSPLVDNVKSDAHHRVTVLLIDSTSGSARLRFVGFPSDLASDRFDVKEIARGLETRWTGSGGAAVRER